LGEAQTWLIGAMTAILGFLGGLAAYRKNHAEVQQRNIAALELRVKILETDNENHLREKTALALKAQLHEDDYRNLFREHAKLDRQLETNSRRIHQLEHWAKARGLELPAPNGEEEDH
jgi:hypothetical protein